MHIINDIKLIDERTEFLQKYYDRENNRLVTENSEERVKESSAERIVPRVGSVGVISIDSVKKRKSVFSETATPHVAMIYSKNLEMEDSVEIGEVSPRLEEEMKVDEHFASTGL